MDADNDLADIDFYDDIVFFRHIRYPQVIIKNPKHIVQILNNKEDVCLGTYGCFLLPDADELFGSILVSRIVETSDELILPTQFNINDYVIKIDGVNMSSNKQKTKKDTNG